MVFAPGVLLCLGLPGFRRQEIGPVNKSLRENRLAIFVLKSSINVQPPRDSVMTTRIGMGRNKH